MNPRKAKKTLQIFPRLMRAHLTLWTDGDEHHHCVDHDCSERSAQSSAVCISRAELSLSIATQGEETADLTARLHTALRFKCWVTEGLSTKVSQWSLILLVLFLV